MSKKNNKKKSNKSKKNKTTKTKTVAKKNKKTIAKTVKVEYKDPVVVVNEKYGHLDVLSPEEAKERAEEEKENKSNLVLEKKKDENGNVIKNLFQFVEAPKEDAKPLDKVIDEIMEQEKETIIHLSSKGKDDKKVEPLKNTLYMFYHVEAVDDTVFAVNTDSDPLYDSLDEAKEILSEMEDGAVWEICAKKVARLSKVVKEAA